MDFYKKELIPFFQWEILKAAWQIAGVLWRDDFSEPAFQGAINAVKGKYFELWAARCLSQILPYGYAVTLADSRVQRGWDLKIANAQNVIFLQVKATNDAAYIYESLSRYPQFRVFTTHEVAHKMRPRRFSKALYILDSGMPNVALEAWIFNEILGNKDFFESLNPPHKKRKRDKSFKKILG